MLQTQVTLQMSYISNLFLLFIVDNPQTCLVLHISANYKFYFKGSSGPTAWDLLRLRLEKTFVKLNPGVEARALFATLRSKSLYEYYNKNRYFLYF